MRGRRNGYTDSVGLSRAGTEVILGSRYEEGRNRREARADSSKHGERQAQLAPWKLWKKDTVQSHISRDSKTVGWGEKEQKTKER